MDFVARQPWGRPADRKRDIYLGIQRARQGPELNEVGARRRSQGIELRRLNAAQFVIVYAYFPPDGEHGQGLVSIRAIRHSRVKNIFSGVREPALRYEVRATPDELAALMR